MTLSLTAMLGAIGLVVDFGWAYWRKEAASTAASSAASAAIAAANSVSNQSCGSGTSYWNCYTGAYSCAASPTLPVSSNLDNGCLYAAQNGFKNTGRQTVTMRSGTGTPPAAPGTSASYWVTATVEEQIPTLFSAVLGQRWMQVAAQATAGIFVGAAGGCIYVLDPSDSGALTMNGNSSISSHCGVYVNSSDPGAISMVGVSSIATTGGAKTWVVGGVSSTPNASITPAAVTGATSTTDPFASQMPTPPSAGACEPSYSSNSSGTIPPGTYCDQISQGGSGTLTLSGGTYILQNGMTSKGSSSIVASGPVTLYLAGGGIDIKGGGGIAFSGPTTGSYQGIAIWQPSSNNSSTTLVGGSTAGVNGLIYMPAAAVTLVGNSTATTNTFVVYTLSVKGTAAISNPAGVPWASLGANGVFIVQ